MVVVVVVVVLGLIEEVIWVGEAGVGGIWV